MATCDLRTKKRLSNAVQGVINAQNGVEKITEALELMPGAGGTDANFVATYIYALAHTGRAAIASATTSEELMAVVAKSGSSEQAQSLLSIPGLETVAAIEEHVKKIVDEGLVQEGLFMAPDSESVLSYTAASPSAVHPVLKASDIKTDMLRRYANRVENTKRLAAGTADSWGVFTESYFSGLGHHGIEFTEWAQDLFFNVMVDNSKNGGFMKNINVKIDKIKKSVTSRALLSLGESTTLAEDMKDEEKKLKYFESVLATDFDFILGFAVPGVAVDNKHTGGGNAEVSGLVIGGELTTVVLDMTIMKRFIPREVDEAAMAQLDPSNKNPDTIYIADKYDASTSAIARITVVPEVMASFIAKDIAESGRIYYMAGDNKYIYKRANGAYIDISPKPLYTFNSSSDRKTTFDNDKSNVFNPLNHGTAFINGLFPMFKVITETGKAGAKNRYSYGRRMTTQDYMLLSAKIGVAPRTRAQLLERLNDIIDENVALSPIARTVLFSIFDSRNYWIDGKNRYSIFKASDTATNDSALTNEAILNALHAALIGKEYMRYVKVVDGNVTISSKFNETDKGGLINDVMGIHLTSGGFTNAVIASNVSVVRGRDIDKVYVKIDSQTKIDLSEANGIENLRAAANLSGLGKIFKGIEEGVEKVHGAVKQVSRDAITSRVMADVFRVAALNLATNPAVNISRGEVGNNFKHPDFNLRSANSVLYNSFDLLGTLVTPDYTKNQAVAGRNYPSLQVPTRDSDMEGIVSRYKAQNNIAEEGTTFNPLINTELQHGIELAEHTGYVLKTPVIHKNKVVKTSDWNLKYRVQYSMQGIMKAHTKNIFYIQPTNYADRSAVPLHELSIPGGDYFLKKDTDTENNSKKLKKAFINYQIKKNEDLQRLSIGFLTDFIAGNFNTIKASLLADDADGSRSAALLELRNQLVYGLYAQSGDMTKGINALLKKVRISPELISYSDTELDADADYITFSGEPDTIYLKPHLGVMAQRYINDGDAMVEQLLEEHLQELEDMGMDDAHMASELLRYKVDLGTADKSSVQEFYDRVFLINGIYGHAVKVLTMGDESYFKGRYEATTMDEYYKLGDTSEVGDMLKAQFKRGQSNLTRGVLYSSKDTLVGLRRKSNKKNIITHLDITSSLVDDVVQERFRFTALEGKSLRELEGMGIIVPGTLAKEGDFFSFDIAVGTKKLTFNTELSQKHKFIDAKAMSPVVYDAVVALIEGAAQIDGMDVEQGSIEPMKVARGSAGAMTEMQVRRFFNSSDKSVTMPDFMPAITLDEPLSNIVLLNAFAESKEGSTTIEVENSDGIQYVHPLMMLIQKLARGGEFGAFDTQNNEAMKMLTTTIEYDRFRQVMQKKSVQNPFTFEQMKKLGSVELYNTLVAMNKAITFTKQNMLMPDGTTMNFENMHDLFNHFGGYADAEAVAWGKVAEVLRLNPVNMFNFVGYINIPSSQKTGIKKLNKFGDVFTNSIDEKLKLNIDYVGNEYNHEVLTKSHEYDTSTNTAAPATVRLASQLVNAVSFGGISLEASALLQDAMEAIIAVNNTAHDHILLDIIGELAADTTNDGKVLTSLKEKIVGGKVFAVPLSEAETDVLSRIVRESFKKIALLSYDSTVDSKLILELIEDEEASFDTSIINQKILSTIRSALFKNATSIRMAGFSGVVSSSYKTITIFDLPAGGRGGRQAYIEESLRLRMHKKQDQVVKIDYADAELMGRIRRGVLPFDNVLVYDKKSKTIRKPITAADANYLVEDTEVDIFVVFTPDVSIEGSTDLTKLPEHALFTVTRNGKEEIGERWYLEEKYGKDNFMDMYHDGLATENTSEKYTLNWYSMQNAAGMNIKNTLAYRNFYKAFSAKDSTVEELRAALVVETQRKDDAGESVWILTKPEVVLPPFMQTDFGLPSNISLYSIIGGTFGEARIEAAYAYFSKQRNKFFKQELGGAPLHQLLSKYRRKVATVGNAHDVAVLEELNRIAERAQGRGRLVNEVILSTSSLVGVNSIIKSAKAAHNRLKAKSFIDTLDVVLARTPGQAKQSGFAARVVEFLGAQGNATFASTEHIANTGGDFDIDTLSVFTRESDNNGIVFDYGAFLTGNKLDVKKVADKLTEEFEDVSDGIYARVDDYNDAIDAEIEDMEKRLLGYQGRAVAPGEEASRDAVLSGLYSVLEGLEEDKISDESIESLVLKAKRLITKRYNSMLKNAIFEGVESGLSSVDNIVEVSSPVSMTILKDDIKPLLSKLNKRVAKGYTPENYLSIYTAEQENANGADGISMYANALKISSLLQAAQNNFVQNYAVNMDQKNPFEIDFVLAFNDPIGGKPIYNHQTTYADLNKQGVSALVANNQRAQKALLDMLQGAKPEGAEEEASQDSLFESMANMYVYSEKDIAFLTDILIESVPNHNNREEGIHRSVLKNLFNVEADRDFANITEVSTFLKSDMSRVRTAFARIIGGVKADEVQSQFLSAATDNAKALLLSKLRANPITNSVVTALLVLGTDVENIVKFLYHEGFDQVFEHISEAHGKLDMKKLDRRTLSEIHFTHNIEDEFKETLNAIIDVATDIGDLRSIRGLQENFKTEQFSLDRILASVEAPLLYSAIVTNNLTPLLVDRSEASPEVNVLALVFLHPQTRAIFKTLYEKESMIRLVFPSVEFIERMLPRSRNEKAYKSVSSLVSNAKLGRFLQQRDDSGVPLKGTVIKDGVPMRTTLHSLANREDFVMNFREYIHHTIAALEATGHESKAREKLFENIVPAQPFGASKTVLTIIKNKSASSSELEKEMATSALNSLLEPTGNMIVDKLQVELYDNLSKYALITSGGKVSKDSMVELFPGIAKELAHFTKKYADTPAFYTELFPDLSRILPVISGEIQTRAELIATYEKYNKEDGDVVRFDMSEMDGYDPAEAMYGRPDYIDFSRTDQTTHPALVRRLYRDEKLDGMLFLGGNKKDASPFMVFDAAARESAPYIEKAELNNSGIEPQMLIDLGRAGKQVGKNIKIDGRGARILNFKHRAIENSVPMDMYTVLDENNTIQTVPAIQLMDANPGMYLQGNLISDLNPYVSKLLAKREGEFVRERIAAGAYAPTSAAVVKGKAIADAFTPTEMLEDPILASESHVIGTLAKEYVGSTFGEEVDSAALREYTENSAFALADKESRTVLIPSFRTPGIDGEAAPLKVRAIKAELVGMLNSMALREDPLVVYGMEGSSDVAKNFEGGLVGGSNILMNLLHEISPSFSTRKTGARQYSGFRVLVEPVESAPKMVKITLIKTADVKIVTLTNKNKQVKVHKGVVAALSDPTENSQANLQLMVEGYADIPYKKISVGEEIYYALNPESKKKMAIFMGLKNKVGTTIYHRVVPTTSNTAEGIGKSNTGEPTVKVIAQRFLDLKQAVLNSEEDINNENCRL